MLSKEEKTNNYWKNNLSYLFMAVAFVASFCMDSSSSKSQGDRELTEDTSEKSTASLVVLFIAGCLVIGGICKEIKKHTGMPYSPLLVIAGALIGRFSFYLGDFGISSDFVMTINPHAIIAIFIPTILFESAYNSDAFVFKKEIYQILTIAVLGVLVGALYLGISFNIILGYSAEIPFVGALLIGAILGSTDPVAVVALLKELGTPIKFNLILEGESLLNDGASIILYIIFSRIYQGESLTVGGIIWSFVWLVGGGCLVGLLIGLLGAAWLSRIPKDDLLTISITILSCYASFYVGEVWLEVSGIVSVVVVGVVMGMHGRFKINPESHHSVHVIWSFVQFAMETTLFIITGLFIGKEIVDVEPSTISWIDFYLSIGFFILMTISRHLMILTILPLMNKTGYHISFKDTLILAYGGLRGGVGLSLALVIMQDNYSKRFKDLVFFNVIIMITLTTLINGLTIGHLMKMIDFIRPDPCKAKYLGLMNKCLVISGVRQIESIRSNRFLSLTEREEVYRLTGLIDLIELERQTQATELQELVDRQRINSALDDEHLLQEDEEQVNLPENRMLLFETRDRIYKLLKSQVNSRFEENLCSDGVVKIISDCCDMCSDELDVNIWIWESISAYLTDHHPGPIVASLQKIPLIGRLIEQYLINDLAETYEILVNLVVSIEDVIAYRKNIPIEAKFRRVVMRELQKNLHKIEKRLYFMADSFPDFIKDVQNKEAAFQILNEQKSLLDQHLNMGILTKKEHAEYRDKLDYEISMLKNSKLTWSSRHKQDDLLFIAPNLSHISSESLKSLSSAKQKVRFHRGQVLYEIGKPVGGLFIVVNGIVQDNITPGYAVRYGMGSFLSYLNVVIGSGVSLTTLTAISDGVAYFIPQSVISEAFERDHNLRDYFIYQALPYFVRIHPMPNSKYRIDETNIPDIIPISDVFLKMPGEKITLEFGGFMFYGDLRLQSGAMRFNRSYIIMPSKEEYEVEKKTLLVGMRTNVDTEMLVVERGSIIRSSFAGKNSILGHSSIAEMHGDVETMFRNIINERASLLDN